MKILIASKLNPIQIMRRSSYGQLRSGSFVRRLGTYNYPRFHAYIENGNINLHLDQKQASYEGSRAHSGEHDSEAVIKEGERIKAVMAGLEQQAVQEAEPQEKKSFFRGLFN